MKVFISWSKDRSKEMAEALHEWLKLVVQAVDPYMSKVDNESGVRWLPKIGEHLESSNFGVLCVTSENQHEPWLNYEAGALAKSFTDARVAPLLLDLTPAQVTGPLSQFQANVANREGVFELVKSINSACATPLDEKALLKTFEVFWPQLEAKLAETHAKGQAVSSGRPPEDMLEELLTLTRAIRRELRTRPTRTNLREAAAQSVRRTIDQRLTDLGFAVSGVHRMDDGELVALVEPDAISADPDAVMFAEAQLRREFGDHVGIGVLTEGPVETPTP